MLVTKDKVFSTTQGNTLFRVQQLPAKRASRFLVRFGRIVGPALGQVAEGDGKLDLDSMEMTGLSTALEKLFAQLTPDEFDWVASELMAGVTVMVDGVAAEVNVDLFFTGKVFEWWKLLFFSFEVSFGDFSGALAVLRSQMKQPARAMGMPGTPTTGSPSSAT